MNCSLNSESECRRCSATIRSPGGLPHKVMLPKGRCRW
jgi:hypothetical protein